MFGGLEIKGESSSSSSSSEMNKKLDGSNDHDDNAATTAPVPVTASVPATTVVQSGFSFLSSSFSSSSAKNSNVDSVAGTMTTTTDPMFGQQQQETQQKQEEEDHEIESVKDYSNEFKVNSGDSILLSVLHPPEPIVSSGFSFLSSAGAGVGGGGATGSSATATGTTIGSDNEDQDSNPQVVVENDDIDEKHAVPPAATMNSSSMFSMLQVKTQDTSSTVATMGKIQPTSLQSNKASHDDILSLSNPSLPLPSSQSTSTTQPTGSGIVFGGAVTKPKTMVKKRSKTKKIGAGSVTTPAIVEDEPTPTTSVVEGMAAESSANVKEEAFSSTTSSTTTTTTTNGNFKALTHEANEAVSRAEEFISSKKSSSVPMSYSTGRYSDTNTTQVEEDYGESYSSTSGLRDDGRYSHSSNEMDDYERAKAAAQEAMKKEASGISSFGLSSSSSSSTSSMRKIGFGGGISGFFKRNLAPVEKKHDDNVSSSHGQSMSLGSSRRGMSDSHGRNEEYYPKGSKESLAGREESVHGYKGADYKGTVAEGEGDDTQEETRRQYLENAENEKRRLEAETQQRLQQEELDRKLAEARRLQEERRKEEERAREEEERKRREAEEEANRTPECLLKRLLQEFADKSQTATLAVANLRQERATMLEKRASAEKQSRMALQQIAQAEKQQMEAAEQEDFELADRLAAVIDQHQREKEELSQVLEKFEGIIEDLDYKRLDVVKRVWLCFIGVQKELQEFLRQQESSEITDDTEIWRKFEDDTKKLAAENERLMSYLKNIERDEGFAREEREELEATIHEQTSGIEELRDAANDKLNIINAEIDELRRQLEAKEMEAAQVKLELHEHEDSIEQIRNKFSRQLHRLEKKESAVRESRKEWETEEHMYKKARENLESEVTAHSEAIVAHDKIIAQVKDEIQVAEELAKIIAQEVMVDRGSDKDNVDTDLVNVQSEVLELEAAAEEANEVLAAATAVITGLNEEIASIDERLPILESEKKTAAANRDFKTAAKASKEIKELTTRKIKCDEDLQGEALERQESAKKLVEGCLQKLEAKKTIAHEKEKEIGVKRMIGLVKKIINLEKLREEVCGTDEEPLEKVKAVGGFVLDSEISALMMEGEELDKQFGGWNDIMLEYASNEIEDETLMDEKVDDAQEVEGKDTVQNSTQDEEQTDGTEVDKSESAEVTNDDTEQTMSKDEIIAKFKDMHDQLLGLEQNLENAIETEEYELAAALDDKIALIKTSIESLDLSEDERNRIISGESDNHDTSEKNEETPCLPPDEISNNVYDLSDNSNEVCGHDNESNEEAYTDNPKKNGNDLDESSTKSDDYDTNSPNTDDHDSTPLPDNESKKTAHQDSPAELSDVDL